MGKRGGTTLRARATEWSQSKATHHSVWHRSGIKRCPHQAALEPHISHRSIIPRIGQRSISTLPVSSTSSVIRYMPVVHPQDIEVLVSKYKRSHGQVQLNHSPAPRLSLLATYAPAFSEAPHTWCLPSNVPRPHGPLPVLLGARHVSQRLHSILALVSCVFAVAS